MRLYHGSENIIKVPKFGAGRAYNDYGQGFYCTTDLELAKEWSVDWNRPGYANEYNLDMEGLTLLNLLGEEYTVLNWLAILVDNRKFDIQSDFGEEARKYLLERFRPYYEQYDVMCGYRADDSYFTFAQDFLNNQISLRTLNKAMYLGQLGIQYVIKSQRAFEMIHYLGAHEASNQKWYPSKEARDASARSRYRELRQLPWQRGEIYMMTIIDEGIGNEDVRLRPESFL